MNRLNALSGVCFISAMLQAKSVDHTASGHALDPIQDRVRAYFPARNQPIAMISICDAKNTVRRDCIPQTDIIERVKPLF